MITELYRLRCRGASEEWNSISFSQEIQIIFCNGHRPTRPAVARHRKRKRE